MQGWVQLKGPCGKFTGLSLKRLRFGGEGYWSTSDGAIKGIVSSAQLTYLDLSRTTIGTGKEPIGDLDYLYPLLPSLMTLILPSIYDPDSQPSAELRTLILDLFDHMLGLCTSLSHLTITVSKNDTPQTISSEIELLLSSTCTSLSSLTIDLGTMYPDHTSAEMLDRVCSAIMEHGSCAFKNGGSFIIRSTIDIVMDGVQVREDLVKQFKTSLGAFYNYRTKLIA